VFLVANLLVMCYLWSSRVIVIIPPVLFMVPLMSRNHKLYETHLLLQCYLCVCLPVLLRWGMAAAAAQFRSGLANLLLKELTPSPPIM